MQHALQNVQSREELQHLLKNVTSGVKMKHYFVSVAFIRILSEVLHLLGSKSNIYTEVLHFKDDYSIISM